MSQVVTFYSDKEKTNALYPRTKLSAISDNDNKALSEIINDTVSELNNSISNEANARQEADNVLNARINTITSLPEGSTTGDAELADIRVGANGTTYPNAGGAVRGQISELKSDLGNFEDVIKDYKIIVNEQFIDENTAQTGRYWKQSVSKVGIDDSQTSYKYFAPVNLKKGTYYYKDVIPSSCILYGGTVTSTTTLKEKTGSEATSGSFTLEGETSIYISTKNTMTAMLTNSEEFPTEYIYGIYGRTYNGVDVRELNDKTDFIDNDVMGIKNQVFEPKNTAPYLSDTFTITPNAEGYIVNGTPATSLYYRIFQDENALFENMNIGEEYYFKSTFNKHDGYGVELAFWDGSEWNTVFGGNENGTFTIPNNAKGMRLRLAFTRYGTFNNELLHLEMFSIYSNRYVFEKLGYIENITPPPILTIIDDDSHNGFYRYVLQIIKDKKVPITSAVVTGWVGEGNTMTWNEISECHSYGAELLSHSHSHLTNEEWNALSIREIQYDYQRSKNLLNEHGIQLDTLIFTGSSGFNEKCIKACKNVFKNGFRAGTQRTNYFRDIDRYGINRWNVSCDNLEDCKTMIDSIYEQGTGWMVWMIHTSYNFTQANADILSSAIDYAISKGIEIVTVERGIRMYVDEEL